MNIDLINPDFFKFCESENIPITTHCAYNPYNEFKPKGFISFGLTINKANEFVNPKLWETFNKKIQS